MAAKCPECGRTLKAWNIKAECPYCGTNIPNYKWEERLEEDSDTAEKAFAKFHYKLANFKSAVVGFASSALCSHLRRLLRLYSRFSNSQ